MMGDGCEEMRLLVQADTDGELQPADAARVAAHLEHCPDCADLQAQLLALSGRLRRSVPRYRAPEELRATIAARLAEASPARRPGRRRLSLPGALSGAGFALAACFALFLVLPHGPGIPDAVVGAHIRALQPGHLMDVVSTDQHTVKPWFDGRLPFAPPVRDFATAGFPLIGGRLDYIAGHTAAVLIYRHRKHVIDLFVWPGSTGLGSAPASGSRDGYNFERWSKNGMTFWAVSNLNTEELADFVRDLQQP